MIQRIQSVYLFLAALLMSALFLPAFDFAQYKENGNPNGIFADGTYNTYDNIILIVLVSGAILLTLINIFVYRNRKLQLLLSRLTIFLMLTMLIASGVLFYLNFENRQNEMSFVHARFGLLLPIVAILLMFFAGKYIRKDEALVKSMDRLR
ncbi:MAG TPA: DUF4293 domain-containing protein [Saprospiraceae bacterium]|nr:DUF4293 domain-containing protein [Saprospiraceae bacterium]